MARSSPPVPARSAGTDSLLNMESAATNAVTFSAIDPKRADEKMYDLYYEPLDANGEIVTTGTGTVSWN